MLQLNKLKKNIDWYIYIYIIISKKSKIILLWTFEFILRIILFFGLFFGPRGIVESSFSWNVGQAFNNQALAYSLLQGFTLAKARNTHRIVILGYSKNTIRHLHLGTFPWDARLSSIFHRIQFLLRSFVKENF